VRNERKFRKDAGGIKEMKNEECLAEELEAD